MVSCVACGFSQILLKSEATNIRFHVFPKDECRRQAWIDFVKKPGWKPKQSSVLCSLHFDEKSFDRTSLLKAKLLPTAIPTIEVDQLKYARLYNPACMYVTEDEQDITDEKIHLRTPISINESLQDTELTKLQSQIRELQKNYVLKCRRIRSLQKVSCRQSKEISTLKSIAAQLKKNNLLFEEEENNLLKQYGINKDMLETLFQKTLDEKKSEDTESSIDDQIPSTSGKGSTELEEIIHKPKQMYSLPENLEKKMIRKKKRARKRLIKKSTDTQSINSEYDSESTISKENSLESQGDELECLTIIGDDNSSSSFKDEQNFERLQNLSPSLPDINSKVLNNSNNEPSSRKQDNHNVLSLSTSESDEDLKKTSTRKIIGKRGRPRFFGDCSSDDMKHPARARICWHVAKKTISELKRKVHALQRQNRNLTQKVEYLQSLFLYLDENNFLNEYSQAVVKAVMSEKVKSSGKD